MDDRNPNNSTSISTTKADRKTIEKNRREEMKALCSRLTSLIPPNHSSREPVSLQEQLDAATNYITTLQGSLEKMRKRKNRLMTTNWSKRSISCSIGGQMSNNNNNNNNDGDKPQTRRRTSVDVYVVGTAVDVVVITGVNCQQHQTVFTEAVRMLHEEGAEVVNASYSVIDLAVFHTIHCKIGEDMQDAFGTAAAARISERLTKFVYDNNN